MCVYFNIFTYEKSTKCALDNGNKKNCCKVSNLSFQVIYKVLFLILQEKNACLLPNECHCPEDTQDPKGLCAPPLILTDEHLQLLDMMILESDSSALKVEAVDFPQVPTMPSLDVKQKNEVEENT